MISPSLVLVIAIALVPGVVAWWTGRKLLRLREDPALPEMLLARQQKLLMTTIAVVVVAGFIGGGYGWWGMLLAPLSLLAGGFPLRRAILGETSGLAHYLWRAVKSILGGLGFWLLLSLTPWIILSVEPRYRLFTIALLLLLLVWEHWYTRIWLWLHYAKPLDDATLAPRVASIVQRAGIPAPDLYMIGAPGSRFVNAVALPALRRPAIALGNAILELLEPDEVAAVYAHELAHIEEHSPRKLRRLQAINRALIVLAVGLPFLVLQLAPSQATWVSTLFPLAVVVALFHRVRHRQKHETESDLRAAALTGDPEAVVRGLIKIHVHGMMPRRWPVDFERTATHPSLARRIQALRGEGPSAVASLGAPTVIKTARESRVVVFDDARAYWFDGVPEGTVNDLESLRTHASGMRSVTWRDLIELRVAVEGDDRALRATHKNGDTWSVPLAPAQVGDVQKALDLVDVRLRRELGKKPRVPLRLVAALALFAMMGSGSFGLVALPALFALMWPSAASLAATGAVVVSNAAIGVLLGDMLLAGTQFATFALVVAVAVGVTALTVAWRRATRDGRRDGLKLTLAVLGVLAVLMLASVMAGVGRVPLRELGDSSVVPALAATLLGMAAAVFVTRPRSWQWLSGALSLAAFGAGSLTLAGADIFSKSPIAEASARASEIRRVNLGSAMAAKLRLSPNGSHFIVERFDSRRASARRQVIGLHSGRQREIEAMQADFVDDARVLTLRDVRDSMELRLERADSNAVEWTTKMRSLDDPTLIVSRGDGRWTVAGTAPDSDSLIVLTGTLRDREVLERRLLSSDSSARAPVVMGAAGLPVVMDGGTRVILPAFGVRGGMAMLPYVGGPTMRVALWEVTPQGRRRLAEFDGFPQCGTSDRSEAVCVARGANRNTLWLLSADGTVRHVGVLPREAIVSTMGPGPRLTLSAGRGFIDAVDAIAKTLTRIQVPADEGYITESHVSAGRLALVRRPGDSTVVVLYRVE